MSEAAPTLASERAPLVPFDGKVSLTSAGLLGLQHVLGMNVYLVPFVLATLLGWGALEKTNLIQATFIASGIATIIQTRLFMRLPVVQGPSYVPMGAAVALAKASGGLAVVYGALLIGAILPFLLGVTRKFHGIVRALIPREVAASIVILTGVGLMPIALRGSIFTTAPGEDIGRNTMLAGATILLICTLMMIGARVRGRWAWIRQSSIIISMGLVTTLAAALGMVDAASLAAAPWFAFPHLPVATFDFEFDLAAILTFLFIYVVLMCEATSLWFTIGSVLGKDISDEQFDRGAMGEGVSCFIAALCGALPVIGFATNAGIMAITGVAARRALLAAGVVLILFGVIGKLSAAIAIIPHAIVGGVFAMVCVIIMMSGTRILQTVQIGEREMLVVGLPTLAVLFATLAPQDLVAGLPVLLQYLVQSSLAFGALCAVLLNVLLPKSR